MKDTREQKGWTFPPGGDCLGTVVRCLPTGDYSIEGLEDRFVVERKRSVAEWAQCLGREWGRFEAELDRMEMVRLPFVVLEFSLDDMMRYPEGCRVPPGAAVRTSPSFLLKRTLEIQALRRAKVVFAGPRGWEVAVSLFKRALEHAGD